MPLTANPIRKARMPEAPPMDNEASMSHPPTLKNGLPIFAYDVKDFCLAVGIGKTKVYEMIKEGRLRSGLLEGKRIIPVNEAQRIIQEALDQESRSSAER
jgi:hypothetical protein